MRRVRVPEPTLAAELENVLDAYQWARDRAYRRAGVLKAQVSLLRRAIALGQVSVAVFRKETGLAGYTASRAVKFLSAEERKWVRCSRRKEDLRVQFIVATPKGVDFLRQIDEEVEKEFYSSLGLKGESARAVRIAGMVKELNQELGDYIRRQALLFE